LSSRLLVLGEGGVFITWFPHLRGCRPGIDHIIPIKLGDQPERKSKFGCGPGNPTQGRPANRNATIAARERQARGPNSRP
jgi:hypothetical protein